jgi:hypothetical protein
MSRSQTARFLSDLQRFGVRRFRGIAPGFGGSPVTIELRAAPPAELPAPSVRAGAGPRLMPATGDAKDGPRDAFAEAMTERGEITPEDGAAVGLGPDGRDQN